MKKTTWVFEFQKHGNFESILHTNFELFRWTISSSLNLLFLKSDFPMRWELFFPEHYVSIFRTLCTILSNICYVKKTEIALDKQWYKH